MQSFDFMWIIAPVLKNAPILLALFLIHCLLKYKHPLANALKSAIPGTVCLFLLNASGNFTGINMPINGTNLSISALLGIPGLGMITILNTLSSL